MVALSLWFKEICNFEFSKVLRMAKLSEWLKTYFNYSIYDILIILFTIYFLERDFYGKTGGYFNLAHHVQKQFPTINAAEWQNFNVLC